MRKHANRSALEQICDTLLKIDVPQLVTVSLIVLVSNICQYTRVTYVLYVCFGACDMCVGVCMIASVVDWLTFRLYEQK